MINLVEGELYTCEKDMCICFWINNLNETKWVSDMYYGDIPTKDFYILFLCSKYYSCETTRKVLICYSFLYREKIIHLDDRNTNRLRLATGK